MDKKMKLVNYDELHEIYVDFYNHAVKEDNRYEQQIYEIAILALEDMPTIEAQPVKQDTELSLILQDYGIKDTDTLRYILDQYQKIIVDITGGQMSYLTYPAQAVIECTNDYYLSALADFKENLVKHGRFKAYSEKEKYEVYKKYHEHFDGVCSECGSNMFESDKFCAECGARMGR